MSLERIPIISKKAIFTVEESPDSTGICFIHKHHGRKRVLATLIDQGDHFDFVIIDHKGFKLTEFTPETVLMLKCGKPAPLESEHQMEVYTTFDRQLIVRHLYADERPAEKVIFSYLYSFAVQKTTTFVLCFPNDLASFLFPSFYIFMSEPPIPLWSRGFACYISELNAMFVIENTCLM